MEILDSLGIDVAVLVGQLVNFVLLFGLLSLFAYKPIMKMMDERSRKIKESMEQAEVIKKQAEQAGVEAEKRIEAAAREGHETVARALRTGEEVKREALVQAKVEAEALVARAKVDIQKERDEAIDSLRTEFADITIQAAEKVIEKSLDKQAHRDIIDKMLEESGTLKKG
jgi:F-type H+-transporting ATPase subunit b